MQGAGHPHRVPDPHGFRATPMPGEITASPQPPEDPRLLPGVLRRRARVLQRPAQGVPHVSGQPSATPLPVPGRRFPAPTAMGAIPQHSSRSAIAGCGDTSTRAPPLPGGAGPSAPAGPAPTHRSGWGVSYIQNGTHGLASIPQSPRERASAGAPALSQHGRDQFPQGPHQIPLRDLGNLITPPDLIYGLPRLGAVRRRNLKAGLLHQSRPADRIATAGGVHHRVAYGPVTRDLDDLDDHLSSLPHMTKLKRNNGQIVTMLPKMPQPCATRKRPATHWRPGVSAVGVDRNARQRARLTARACGSRAGDLLIQALSSERERCQVLRSLSHRGTIRR